MIGRFIKKKDIRLLPESDSNLSTLTLAMT